MKDERAQWSDASLDELEARVSKLEARFADEAEPSHATSRKPISIREFMQTANPSTDVDKVLIIARYLELEAKLTSVNLIDLRGAFSSAREPVPRNVNDAVNKNVSKGLMMVALSEKDGYKAWTLTNSGEATVSKMLQSGVPRK